MLNPFLAMLIIALILGGLLFGLRLLQNRFDIHPEVSRKLMHVIMGLTTLNLPWLFDQRWPVVSLAVVTAIGLFLLKRTKLKASIGQVLHGVGRSSQGDVAFPLAVATVFVLANGNAILYCIPILILTIADATAALIGLRYGLSRYQAAEGQKSIEGSLAFFAISFNSVLLSLLLFTQVGRQESILIAFLLGLLVMMLEAISWQGLDNLFIPLAGFLLLESYLTMAVTDLLINLAVVLGLVLYVLMGRQAGGFDPTAVMTAALIGYLIWSTGGWLWMIAPLTLFAAYSFVLPKRFEISPDAKDEHAFRLKAFPVDTYTVYTVLSATLPGLFWLFLAQNFQAPELIYPYMISFACYLMIVGMGRMNAEGRLSEKLRTFWESVFYAWTLIPFIFYVWQLPSFKASLYLLVSLLILSLSAWAFYYMQPRIEARPFDMQRWRWQGALAGLGSSLALIPLLLLTLKG
ncbi:MAG: hypothetical protein KC422_17875 [Trueperaceae bacterium]|nr:hypothetical protein [Trueperaceae bacterium]